MKVSAFLREYQLTGNLPKAENPLCAFWARWMMGNATRGKVAVSTEEAITLAIQAAEFIEAQQ